MNQYFFITLHNRKGFLKNRGWLLRKVNKHIHYNNASLTKQRQSETWKRCAVPTEQSLLLLFFIMVEFIMVDRAYYGQKPAVARVVEHVS